MMMVKWEFEGDETAQAAAETAVQRLLYRCSGPLAARCPVHGEVPMVKVCGHSFETLDLAVETCCEANGAAPSVPIDGI